MPNHDMMVRKFSTLSSVESGERILLYPAASGSSYFLDFMRRRRPDLAARVVGLADKDTHKQGLTQNNLYIFAPEKLPELNVDMVILTSSENASQMYESLSQLLPGARILLADDIREYWDEAAKSSVLAQRIHQSAPAQIPAESLGHFFLGMPLGGGTYARSTKGALTYQFLEQIRLPQDITGRRVLELGAAEGFYGFECEARGASQVVAAEAVWLSAAGMSRFEFCKKLYSSTKVLPVATYVEDLHAERYGSFDLTLCLGLYYHLKDPFLCLRQLAAVTTGTLLISGRTVRAAAFDPFHRGEPASLMMLSDKEVGKWTATT